MKKINLYIAALAVTFSLISCQEDSLSDESVINVQTVEQTDFDKWLQKNFVEPYNIDFKYRFEMGESDMNYYTIPAKYELAIKMAHLVKYLCVDTYDEVAGPEFTRGNFPKMFFLIGTWEYKNNGTFILGTAEGGRKILLAGINELTDELCTDTEALNYYYIKTIHHEFTHILNQTRDFPTAFKEVTGSKYVAGSWSTSPFSDKGVCLLRGFITAYAENEAREDFAEMVSEYITHDADWWEKQMKDAEGTWDGDLDQTISGRELIEQKLGITRAYLHDVWGIDIDQLRQVVMRRQNDIANGRIDLNNIEL